MGLSNHLLVVAGRRVPMDRQVHQDRLDLKARQNQMVLPDLVVLLGLMVRPDRSGRLVQKAHLLVLKDRQGQRVHQDPRVRLVLRGRLDRPVRRVLELRLVPLDQQDLQLRLVQLALLGHSVRQDHRDLMVHRVLPDQHHR